LPKCDKLFDDNQDGIHVAASTEEWEDIQAREVAEDRKLQERLARQHQAWLTIDPQIIQKITNILSPFVMPDRWERMQSVFQKRTRMLFYCLEILQSFQCLGMFTTT
jgi:hypothetical protein